MPAILQTRAASARSVPPLAHFLHTTHDLTQDAVLLTIWRQSFIQLSKQIAWLSKQDFECKIVIAGNHDLTLDADFYAQHGLDHHSANPQSPADCQRLLAETPEIYYLNHSGATVTLSSPMGPRTTFSVFGSPHTPKMGTSTVDWAFQYGRRRCPRGDLDEATGHRLWRTIPMDTDILVTHGPARTHRDEQYLRPNGSGGGPAGCEALRQAMWRVRPRLAVCGHIHEGRGVERVRWDLDSINVRFKEKAIEHWDDPGQGNNKLCLVDLSRKGGKPLCNDGSRAVLPGSSMRDDEAGPGIGVEGLGGNPSSPRSDQPALIGRQGRAETCIINCAIMSGSYPHRGPRRLMKPIVVDIDLPVCG